MNVDSTNMMVLEVLQGAASQNPDVLKPAEAKLKEWETQPGFYTTLFNVISTHSIDINVRWIAVLYMKNGLDKYWRKNAPNAIAVDEKNTIKQGLISDFIEPIYQIAIQRAVLVAKIARMDCPKEWPELFPTLLTAVESSDSLVQHRSLLTLHHVVKAISSKRLAGDRRIFYEFTLNIYNFILNLWNNYTEAFVRDISEGATAESITVNLEKALLTLRILRKLSVFGFYKPHESESCMSFLKILFEKAKVVLQCRKQLKGKGIYVLELCEKFIIHLTKVLLSVLDTHPFSFIDFIQLSLEFTFFYLFTDEGINFVFERFVIQCFNLIKNILLCVEYKSVKSDLNKYPDTVKATKIKQEFFQPDRVADMCRKLIGHYFILTQDELDTWDSDPEDFSNDESGDSWKYSLRPSTDTVFVTIFHEYRDTLTPVVLELVAETNVLVSPNDMQAILKKDAVYNAVGLCAFDLYDAIDFDAWFTNTLYQELKVKDNNYRVIRRRVTALIGRWTGIKLSSELRPVLYECINNLLDPKEDMAVRLTAASTLRYAIDDFEFNCDQFKDYMFTSFNLLFTLLKEARECETKMQVLNVMTLLLEIMGGVLQLELDSLVQYLPYLWQESEEHNMLRCAIVATLVQLVKALKGVKPELNPFLLPIIQLGTDVSQSAIVYLLEDCLNLWMTVLEYSTTMSEPLLQLFNCMGSLLEYSTENLRHCLLISLVHLLLAPELIMRTQGVQLMQVCDGLMGDLKNEGIVMLMRLVETFLRASPTLGAETTLPILPRIFEKIYVGESYPMLLSMYLCVMSRVLLSSHEVFTRVLSKLAQSSRETEQVIMCKLLDMWLDKMRHVSQPDHRKLLGLALTNLLTTQSTPVFERFGLVMLNILETLNDITRTEDNGVIVDSLVLTEGQSPSDFEDEDCYYETDHNQRRKQLILSDPVHTIVLKDYLQSQLVQLKTQVGEQQYGFLLQTVDQDTLSQLKDYIML
ncbi:importin-11-like [Diabrotica undecimpunctata]|uniref:importin-11-like n=1 Tax=Diabrotica undecimpunctata TaxID=50387 RepID=UPI003B63F4DC